MKKGLDILVAAAFATLFLASCSQSPISPNGSGNLIQNSDLRSGNNPSLAGWKINDTAWVKVVANAPPGGGTWSLWLAPMFGPEPGGMARTFVTGQSGEGVYTLTCWERNFSGWYWGSVSLAQFRGGREISYRSLDMKDTSWTEFTLEDTLFLQPSDTLGIELTAPSLIYAPEYGAGYVDTVSGGACFNQLSLQKTETTR